MYQLCVDLSKLPPQYGIAILGLMIIYAIIIQIYKKIYLKNNIKI